MVRRGRQRGLLYEVFFTEWKNKSTALILALVIWGITFYASLAEEEFDVVVLVTASKADECVTELTVVEDASREDIQKPFDYKVKLTVKGTARNIGNARGGTYVGKFRVDPDGRVDLRDTGAYGLPRGLEVGKTDPVMLEATTDQLITRTLPVTVRALGEKAGRSFDPTLTSCDPPSFTLRFPSELEGKIRLMASVDISDWSPGATFVTNAVIVSPYDAQKQDRLVQLMEAENLGVTVTPGLKDVRQVVTEKVPVMYASLRPTEFSVKETEVEVEVTVEATAEALEEWRANIASDKCFIFVRVPAQVLENMQSVAAADVEDYFLFGFPEPPDLEVQEFNPTIRYRTRKIPNE